MYSYIIKFDKKQVFVINIDKFIENSSKNTPFFQKYDMFFIQYSESPSQIPITPRIFIGQTESCAKPQQVRASTTTAMPLFPDVIETPVILFSLKLRVNVMYRKIAPTGMRMINNCIFRQKKGGHSLLFRSANVVKDRSSLVSPFKQTICSQDTPRFFHRLSSDF